LILTQNWRAIVGESQTRLETRSGDGKLDAEYGAAEKTLKPAIDIKPDDPQDPSFVF
jgi:hypothetical protein